MLICRPVLFLVAAGALILSGKPAQAAQITITASGTITGVFDNTGALAGSGIVAGTSTFTATFFYDTATLPWSSFSGSSGDFAQYWVSPIGSLTIDGAHTFTHDASPGGQIYMKDNTTSFGDRLDWSPDSTEMIFPFTFSQTDNLFRLSLGDSTSSAFSSVALPLPSDLVLSDFSTRELFIRTDLDRANNKLWTINGRITSLTATAASPVPEPATLSLLGVGLAGAAVRRFRKRS